MTRLLFPKPRPLLNEDQFQRCSNILDNAGQIVLGIMILGQLFTSTFPNIFIIGLGMITVSITWFFSLVLAKKGGDSFGY